MPQYIEILDSTLRDGAQSEGISFSIEDKLNILRALDALGIPYIEAGNPGSNPKDIEFFRRAAGLQLKHGRLVAFGSTRRKNICVAQDETMQHILGAHTPCVIVFGKSWGLHVTEILGTSMEENLAMIYDTIAYLSDQGREVFYDAEHFFDGFKADPEYAMRCIRKAQEAGAKRITLCDTNGGTFPEEIHEMVLSAVKELGDCIGIHCHNDSGCAVACSLAAVRAGAIHVQGTLVGFGERCGNTNLSTVIANLQLKMGMHCIPDEQLSELTRTTRYVAEISNTSIPRNTPFVGHSAFAHKAGMHADGVAKVPCSFEHIDPNAIGNRRRFPASEMAGRTAILTKIQSFAGGLSKDSAEVRGILAHLKEMELEGWQFESAEASFELFVRKQLGRFTPHFQLDYYKVDMEHPARGRYSTLASIKIRVDDRVEITAAEGDGPVHALDCALRKALDVFYPSLSAVHLIDFKVRVLNPEAATAASVRVLITSTDGRHIWSTVAASSDVIEASWMALADSIEYKLMLDAREKKSISE